MCAATTVGRYLKTHRYKGMTYILGTEKGLGAELKEFGIKNRSFTPNIEDEAELLKMELDEDIYCVVVGMDPDFNYTKLFKAANLLRRPGCLFVSCNSDKNYHVKAPANIVPGTQTRMLELGTLFAKNCGLHYMVVLTGETAPTDLGLGAKEFVRVFQPEVSEVPSAISSEEESLPPDEGLALIKPDYYIDSVKALGELLAIHGAIAEETEENEPEGGVEEEDEPQKEDVTL
ncbi:phosphoglycolate phosphatase [Plakobranchus ocellatus]|uniref:Phosphoglycolate phosphatase n=1 Tax=Plakobranchus ocellatus TaxID=259542 RepID=A0AAV4ANT3_9GAST|nr:phosphoglycolate phosphatase [Plakobranchus ocellatus]